MSDSNSPAPKSPQNEPTPPRPGRTRRNDRSPIHILLWVAAGGTALACFYFFMNEQHSGKEISLGEFQQHVEDGTLNSKNVFDLKFTPGWIQFQDQPIKKSSKKEPGGSDENKPVQKTSVSTYLMGSEKEADLTRLLSSKGIDFGYPPPPPDWYALRMWVPAIIMLLVMVYFLRRMVGTGAAMSFGRSRGRLYAQEDIDITFTDAAGIDEAVNELREVVEFLRTPGKYKALGGRIPRGVLLVGPPGTGKTLLGQGRRRRGGRSLLQPVGIPTSSRCMSASVRPASATCSTRRDSRSPSIIFIDELDALGKVRGSGSPGGHDEREQTLNALLVEMDGFSSDQSVIVMGATEPARNARSRALAARPLRSARARRSARHQGPRSDPQGARRPHQDGRQGRSAPGSPSSRRALSGPIWPTSSTRPRLAGGPREQIAA